MPILISELGEIIKNSEYYGGYHFDLPPSKAGAKYRKYLLSNETIFVETPYTTFPISETTEVPVLMVYTKVINGKKFEDIAKNIAKKSKTELRLDSRPSFVDNDFFKFTFFNKIYELDETINSIKNIEVARELLYPYLYPHIKYIKR